MKKLAVAIATITALFGFASAAHAQYTSPGVTVSVSNPSPPAGGTTTVSVAGCLPNESVLVTFNGASSTVSADASGAASATLNAPNSAGVFNGSITCNGTVTNFQITVAAPAPGLPATGSDGAFPTAAIAFGLLAVGAGLVGVSQLRRRHELAA